MEQDFEALSHPNYKLQESGSTVARDKMKSIQAKAFELGSTATLYKFVPLSEDKVEFRFRLVNDQFDMMVHNIATIQDGMIINEEPVECSKPLLMINLEAYIASMDGSPKSLNPLFDEIYHEEYEYRGRNGDVFHKQQLREYHTNSFENGNKATLLSYKEIDADHVEFKLRKESDKLDVIFWNVAKVKENKIVSVTPYNEESEESINRFRQVWSVDSNKVVMSSKNASLETTGNGDVIAPQ